MSCDSCLILFINTDINEYVHTFNMTSKMTSSYFPVMKDTFYHFKFAFYKRSIKNNLKVQR